ncbi:hypothetical protein VPNG_02984 [Cytospora leucostoma]|uniref:Myb/SANT-like domain-containing protein n=1 Tax=Cytospora leucostoma TaxID=1230097 RepID=A0A423XG57_9PEZI|nr:hypothetical protein VPNG_02984 [Cytospora leucostoma]
MSDGEDYGSPEATQVNDSNAGRQHTPTNRKGPRFSWTPAYEKTFFRSLCQSVKIGLKDNHSFKQEAWDRACQALAEQHNAYPNKGHLINKSDNARKKFRLWRGLREDPEFLYNPNTKVVTASEEAWRAHIEREPLSKSLRNRPFEHEEYMEILFPDVVGSGGAPKRITKPRRKGTDVMPDADEFDDTPGTNVLNLLSADNTMFQTTPTQTPIQPPTVPSNGNIRPTSTILPARTSIASSSALTPPDEEPGHSSTHTRKRLLPSTNGAGPSTEKRRRTGGGGNNNYIDLTHSAQLANGDNHILQLGSISRSSSNGASNTISGALASQQNTHSNNNNNNSSNIGNNNIPSSTIGVGSGGGGGGGGGGLTRQQQFQDAMMTIAEQIRAQRFGVPQPQPHNYPQQAMDIFFRDFGDEDQDLQIKIGEKVLCDNNKAMMFCMMPEDLRRHWVKRLRELHNRVPGEAAGVVPGAGAGAGPTQGILVPGPGIGGVTGGGNALAPGSMQMAAVGNHPMMRNGSQVG